MNFDLRFVQDAGREIFTGNELLVKGALETDGGVHLLTGCPGWPLAGFFDALALAQPLLDEKGMVGRVAPSEAISIAQVRGAQLAGGRAMAVVNLAGLLAARDVLTLGVLTGEGGAGAVVVCGDDPIGHWTVAETDPRSLAQYLGMPLVEPSGPQEVKDWINLAFALGRAGQTCVGYRVTDRLLTGGATVGCHPNHFPVVNRHQRKTLDPERRIESGPERFASLPGPLCDQSPRERRLQLVAAEARRLGINQILHQPQKGQVVPLGLVAAGSAYAHLSDALVEMGLAGRMPILKLGLSFPVDEQIVAEFAGQCRQVVVIEPRHGFVEKQVLAILGPLVQAGRLGVTVHGKRFPDNRPGVPEAGGLDLSVLIERLVKVVQDHGVLPAEGFGGLLAAQSDPVGRGTASETSLPDRTPSFCPGCPHRDASSVLLALRRDLRDPQYMLEHHKRKPVDLVVHGEGGCHSMFMFEPNRSLVHSQTGPALAGGVGSGAGHLIDNKQVVFLGDGTFGRGGQNAIGHAIGAGQNITYVILGDQVTAATLPQPGDLAGRRSANASDIERAIRAMVPKERARTTSVVRIHPDDHKRYRRLLEQMILSDGVKVVIADKACGVVRQREALAQERRVNRALGYLPRKTYMSVATEVCENCLECSRQTGCSGLTVQDTDYGPKIQTDLSSCVNDGACQKVDVCPAFEQITIVRKRPSCQSNPDAAPADLPPPVRPLHADQKTWRCHVAGVGGGGARLCVKVLAAAGHAMGYDVRFLVDGGLAVRGGGVHAQLVYTRIDAQDHGLGQPTLGVTAAQATTATIPRGKADLVVGMDLLEAARGVDRGGRYGVSVPAHTAAVLNTSPPHTTRSLMGLDTLDSQTLEDSVQRHVHPDRCFGLNVGDLCERFMGSKRHVNAMVLGIAYQKGYLPVTLAAIEQAVVKVMRPASDNLRAFGLGRQLAAQPRRPAAAEAERELETAGKAVRRKIGTLRARFGSPKQAKQFRVLLRQTFRAARGHHLDDQLRRDVVIRMHDCLIWGGAGYAQRYSRRLIQVLEKDDPGRGYAVTRAVVWNLAKAMLIKDEIYVAALLNDPEKLRRDRRRFNVNVHNGDRLIYRYHHHPQFKVLGWRVRFEWRSRPWQLWAMSRMGFLRDVLPGWHRRERRFRDWYEALVDRFDWQRSQGPRHYQRWLAVLSVPEVVNGYRDVRYPKMQAARQRADQLLATDPDLFEPEGAALAKNRLARTVRLPVLAGAGGR